MTMMEMQNTSTVVSSIKKTIVFENNEHWVGNILDSVGDTLGYTVNVMGKPLIVHNVEKLLLAHQSINHIVLPEGISQTTTLLQSRFPSIKMDEYPNEKDLDLSQEESIRIPINAAVIDSGPGRFTIRQIYYPWDLIKIVHEVLTSEVKTTKISNDASIAESSIVKGPCVIDDGVQIDDFNKIIGPIYIGKDSRIGTGNLVRHSMIGEKTSIGFSCEMARSLLIGESKISHHDVILDSVVGRKCWFGAFVGTTNLLLNNENVKFRLGDSISSTGLPNFGSVIGHDCSVGAGVILLPGRQLKPNSIVSAGTVVSK